MEAFLEPLSYGFFLRALAAVVLVGIACAIMGSYVVLKGLAFAGDAISHAALPGVEVAIHDRDAVRAAALVGVAAAIPGIGAARAADDARTAVRDADVVVTCVSFGPVRQVMKGDWFAPGALVVAVVALAVMWMTNLYNFMDGSDGLAGGMTVCGFGFLGLAAWVGNDMTLALAALCIAAPALVFLFYNFHPARIFMGDTGSLTVGFLLGFLAVQLTQRPGGHLNVLAPVVVLGLPVFDTALVLEEIAKVCYVTAMAVLGEVGVQTRIISTYGTPAFGFTPGARPASGSSSRSAATWPTTRRRPRASG